MQSQKFESVEHFVNTVRYLRKKRKQSTYLYKPFVELLNQAYFLSEDLCSEYIQFTRLELTNTVIDENHFMQFFANSIGRDLNDLIKEVEELESNSKALVN